MALDFDGIDDIGSATITAIGSSSWTIGGWIKPRTSGEGNTGRIVHLGGSLGQTQFFTLNTGKLHAFQAATTNAAAITGTNIPLNEWLFVVATYDTADSKSRVYRGSLSATVAEETYSQQTAAVGAMTGGGTAARIGNVGGLTATFDGDITRPFIFKRLLTLSEMETLRKGSHPTQDGNLLAYWKLDEGTGTTANDSSGNGAHASITGALWDVDPSFSEAKSGSAVVSGTGTVVASGRRGASGAAVVGGAGQVVATGRRGAQASATVASGGTVTAVGTRQGATTAAVSGPGAVSAAGAKATATSALVTGASSATAAGRKSSTSTAGVIGTGTVVATGSGASAPAAAGTALVVGVGSVSAVGAKGVGGVVATSGAGQIGASGRKGGAGTAGVTGAGAVLATGVKRDTVLGTVGVSGAGSVVVAGAKRTGAMAALFGTGGVSVAALAARGGTASVAALGLVQTTAGARFPIPVSAVVTLARPGARISVSRTTPARSSGPSGSVFVSSGGATVST